MFGCGVDCGLGAIGLGMVLVDVDYGKWWAGRGAIESGIRWQDGLV